MEVPDVELVVKRARKGDSNKVRREQNVDDALWGQPMDVSLKGLPEEKCEGTTLLAGNGPAQGMSCHDSELT